MGRGQGSCRARARDGARNFGFSRIRDCYVEIVNKIEAGVEDRVMNRCKCRFWRN